MNSYLTFLITQIHVPQPLCITLFVNSPLSYKFKIYERYNDCFSVVVVDLDEAKSEVTASVTKIPSTPVIKKRKIENNEDNSIALILDMHRKEHLLRMKYIEEEHSMKVKEHLLRMEILQKKLDD